MFVVGFAVLGVWAVSSFATDSRSSPSHNSDETYNAILWLHSLMDDDKDGNINLEESSGFLHDELNKQSDLRHLLFHRDDPTISRDELWTQWIQSDVHNWTVEDVIIWLKEEVQLPQYEQSFRSQDISGSSLPLLISLSSSNVFNDLHIDSHRHRQKITLKTMDIVLFGPTKRATLLKDILLLTGFLISLLISWYLYYQHYKSQAQLKKVLKHLESLQSAEEMLKGLNSNDADQTLRSSKDKELCNCKVEYSSSNEDLDKPSIGSDLTAMRKAFEASEEEVSNLKSRLRQAELLIRTTKSQSALSLPPLLVEWLQITYEVESESYFAKKREAEKQLKIAKLNCEKLNKKRSSLLGSLQVAHGNSLDQVDQSINMAKTALFEVKRNLDERTNRWNKIEFLLQAHIAKNPGITELYRYVTDMEDLIKSSDRFLPSAPLNKNPSHLQWSNKQILGDSYRGNETLRNSLSPTSSIAQDFESSLHHDAVSIDSNSTLTTAILHTSKSVPENVYMLALSSNDSVSRIPHSTSLGPVSADRRKINPAIGDIEDDSLSIHSTGSAAESILSSLSLNNSLEVPATQKKKKSKLVKMLSRSSKLKVS